MMILPLPVPPAPPAPHGRTAAPSPQEHLHHVNGRTPLPRVRAGTSSTQAAQESLEQKLARQRLQVACAHARAEGKREGYQAGTKTVARVRADAWWSGLFCGAMGTIGIAFAWALFR